MKRKEQQQLSEQKNEGKFKRKALVNVERLKGKAKDNPSWEKDKEFENFMESVYRLFG